MRALSTPEIIEVWEREADQHPLDRAVGIVAACVSALEDGDAAALPIGARDAHLLAIREATFGHKASAIADCPVCSQRLEFDIDMRELRASAARAGEVFEFEGGDFRFTFRLPDSRDLAEIVNSGGADRAREMLLARCVVSASAPVGEAPAEVVDQLLATMSECDPQADVAFQLTCAACGSGFSTPFDIAGFFWTELASEAKRLLREVHELASRYGWRESEILAMSRRRRQSYMDMVGA